MEEAQILTDLQQELRLEAQKQTEIMSRLLMHTVHLIISRQRKT